MSNFSDRIQADIMVGNHLVYVDHGDRIVTATHESFVMNGLDLAKRLIKAKQVLRRLQLAITDMEQLLNTGFTKEEHDRNLESMKADPERSARLFGWSFCYELKKALDGHPFANWLYDHNKNIVRLSYSRSIEHIKNKYPERHQYAGDYLEQVGTWAEALELSLKKNQETQAKRVKKLLEGEDA